ncbi:unnamed protein product [Prorocentrum cordatum]|uniref:Uncharacterized protein n=1 Tax=Prorocentrum cordatum TaxID=2364126 RepID=A0ABN9PF33_9DINO|nr:unnamed protein product [Polarella glacialis]
MDRCALTGCRATGPRVQIAAPIASCSGRRGEHTASGILLELMTRPTPWQGQMPDVPAPLGGNERGRRKGDTGTRRSKYERGGPAGAPSTTLRPGRACRAMPPRRLPECREKTPTEAAARARGTRVEVLHPAKCLRNHGLRNSYMHTPQRSQPLGLLEAVVATARRGRSARRGRGSSDGRRALACSSCRRPRSSAPGRGPSARPSRGAISLKSVSPPPRAGGPVHEQKGAQGLLPLGQARPAPFSAACPVGARFWQDDPGRSSMAPAGKLLTPERCRKNGPGRAVA